MRVASEDRKAKARKRVAAWQRENRDRKRAYDQEYLQRPEVKQRRAAQAAHRYKRMRVRAIQYLGGKCARCGASDRLEFDHVDPSTKSFTISGHLNRKWEDVVGELDKCQLLCQEHHAEKTADNGDRTAWRELVDD